MYFTTKPPENGSQEVYLRASSVGWSLAGPRWDQNRTSLPGLRRRSVVVVKVILLPSRACIIIDFRLSVSTALQDFSNWPDEVFEEMDSTLAVQQYIQQMIKKDPSNVDQILTMPDGQDEGVWKYEHLRYVPGEGKWKWKRESIT